jgi:hypothetical protein
MSVCVLSSRLSSPSNVRGCSPADDCCFRSPSTPPFRPPPRPSFSTLIRLPQRFFRERNIGFVFLELAPQANTHPSSSFNIVLDSQQQHNIRLINSQRSESIVVKMPIKWSADKDHLVCAIYLSTTVIYALINTNSTYQLLLKIIETHNIKLDTNKVAEAWRKLIPCL